MKRYMDEIQRIPTRFEWERCLTGEGMKREGIKACGVIKQEQDYIDNGRFDTGNAREDYELTFQRISKIMEVCQACQRLLGGKEKYRNKQHIVQLPCQRLREEVTEKLGRKWNSSVFGEKEHQEEENEKGSSSRRAN